MIGLDEFVKSNGERFDPMRRVPTNVTISVDGYSGYMRNF